MYKYFLLLVLSCTVLINCCLSQQSTGGAFTSFKPPVNLAPAVPNVAAFEKFGNIPVNASSGLPQINIPVWEFNLKGFKWPVSLSYHAAGNKNSDIASNVGLGWILNAAGAISLSGRPGVNETEIRRSLNLQYTQIGNVDICEPKNESDLQIAQDILEGDYALKTYSLNTPVVNNKFFLVGGVGATFPASNTRISQGSGLFTIYDESGNKYEFSTQTVSQQTSSCGGPSTAFYNQRTPNTSYLLTRVITYNNDTLVFKYSNESYSYTKAPMLIKRRSYQGNQSNYCNPLVVEDISCENVYLANDKRLDAIEGSDGTILKLSYSTRLDLPGSSRLVKIEVFKKLNDVEEKLKSLEMVQSYFGSGTDQFNLRLRLDEVRNIDKVDNFVNKYRLFYNTTPFPSRLTLDYEFVGAIDNASIVGISNITRAGVLERIEYPTGGETIFNYEIAKSTGKLRLNRIADLDNNNKLTNERAYLYPQSTSEIYPAAFNRIEETFKPLQLSPNNEPQLYSCNVVYWQSEPIIDEYEGLEQENDFYPEVTELYGDNGINGKTEFLYAKPARTGSEILPNDAVLINKRIYKFVSSSNSFELQQEETMDYSIPTGENLIENYPYGSDLLERDIWIKEVRNSRPLVTYQSPYSSAIFSWCPEWTQLDKRISSAPVRLTKTTSKRYENGDLTNPMVTVTDYVYEDPLNLTPTTIETVNSKGVRQSTRTWFPTSTAPPSVSFNAAEQAAINYMTSKNNIKIPYYTVEKNGTQILNSRFASFEVLSTGPAKIKSEKLYHQGGTGYSEYKIVGYDGEYNPTELIGQDGISSAVLYQKKNGSILATITGSGFNQVAFASFEPDENTNFTSFSSLRITGDAVTGNFSYNLSNGSISKTNLQASIKSLVSVWVKSGSVLVNGSQPIFKKVKNGWSLYEITLNAASITISGTAQIDELRIYPETAFMKTFSYNSNGTLNSICDENNNFSKYYYDGALRLSRIVDDEGNIRKLVNYSYATKNSNWQKTGSTRCRPCNLNSQFSTDIVEAEERDANTQSSSYNTVRWIPTGEISTLCSTNSDFVATSTYRCKTYTAPDGQQRNTGWRERKYINQNPCRGSFGVEIWQLDNAAVGICQPTVVFAKYSIQNQMFFAGETYGDLVVEFFSDYYCTIPVTVSNLPIKIQTETLRSNGENSSFTTQYTANGSSFTLNSVLLTVYITDPYYFESNVYQLIDDSNLYDLGSSN